MSEWQPIETIPKRKTVLVAYDDGCVCEGYTFGYEDKLIGYRGEGRQRCGTVTHWMPLPKPPTEDKTWEPTYDRLIEEKPTNIKR